MTGQDIQDRFDDLIADLGLPENTDKTAVISFRNPDNTMTTFEIQNVGGVVHAGQTAAVQDFIDDLKPVATTYEDERAPVTAALEAVATERAGHQALIDELDMRNATLRASAAYIAAQTARTNLNTALAGDADYQTAVAALNAAKLDVNYVDALSDYRSKKVSENYDNLGDAKGNYVG